MSAANELLGFYTRLLESVDVKDVSEGRLSVMIPDHDGGERIEKPCVLNNKRLVLPTKEVLKSADWSQVVAFHPLSEHMARGQSDVIKYLRKLLMYRLNGVATTLLQSLMTIASDHELQEQLTPRQAEYLAKVPDANPKITASFAKLMENHSQDNINIYLKHKGKHNGEDYRRVASLSFPIWDELQKEGNKVYGVDFGSKKAKATVVALYEVVFKDLDNADEWSVGSNDTVAPYFDALVRCYAQMAEHLNKIVYKYRKYVEYHDFHRSELDWMEDLDRLDDWKNAIPALEGNKGSVPSTSPEEQATKPVPAYLRNVPAEQNAPSREESAPWQEDAPVAPAPSLRQPAPLRASSQPEPQTQQPSNGKLDWSEVMRRKEQQRNTHHQPQPTPPQYGYPQQPQQQPIYGTPIQPQGSLRSPYNPQGGGWGRRGGGSV